MAYLRVPPVTPPCEAKKREGMNDYGGIHTARSFLIHCAVVSLPLCAVVSLPLCAVVSLPLPPLPPLPPSLCAGGSDAGCTKRVVEPEHFQDSGVPAFGISMTPGYMLVNDSGVPADTTPLSHTVAQNTLFKKTVLYYVVDI